MFSLAVASWSWAWLVALATPYIFPVIIGIVTVGFILLLMNRKVNNASQYALIKIVLTYAHNIFGDKLGAQASKVFDIWVACMNEVQAETMTQSEMLEKFWEIVNATKGIVPLTDTQKEVITSVTEQSFGMLDIPEVKNTVSISSVKL
jgi:predicted acetyltransferase